MKTRSLGIRGKLILIFILIKVLPLMFLAWFAWDQVAKLGLVVGDRTRELSADTREIVGQMGDLASQDSIAALDEKSRETIERLTTDTARLVADFLYDRDRDVLQAANLAPDEASYRRFLAPLTRPVVLHGKWILDEATDTWRSAIPALRPDQSVIARNPDNAKDFHYRAPEEPGIVDFRPLYHEMTFVGLDGRERIKISLTDLLPQGLGNVADPANTFCKAETYFEELKRLKPGEVYVSEVIGPYVKSLLIGPYTRARADKAGVEFAPEKSGYAGRENPAGKRFEGIIRWGAPVVRNGAVIGYVTLALDHTHVMEFTDHVIPTEQRYSPISDAASGNYAFMWDYKGRNISHPRDYFICGYDPETGQPAPPWMDTELYALWQESGLSMAEFQKIAPTFQKQSLTKKPAEELTRQGLVALDGRYLNFAPQCTGWHNLTSSGGSGSFVIFWSGLWKLTTAATIPYRTGRYGDHPRGFGYVTIGANVHEFHRAATETAEKLETMMSGFERSLQDRNNQTQSMLATAVQATARSLGLSTTVMVAFVILIAIWMASTITRRITSMVAVVRRFKGGDMDSRIETTGRDEVAQLGEAYNDMAASVKQSFATIQAAEAKYRGMVEHAAAGIFQSTPDGRFVSVNPAMARMFGYDSPEEMLTSVEDISTQIYVDGNERDKLLKMFETQDEVRDFVFRGLKKDGAIGLFTDSMRKVTNPTDGSVYIEGMMLDVSDREEKERAKRARNMAEAANQAKSDFLARMSHEIRTPMNAVIGVADLLEESELNDDQEVLVSLLKSAGGNLLALIDDILDLSKIDAGKIEIRQTPFDLREELAATVSMLAHRAYEKGLDIEYEVDEDIPARVEGDASHIRQVLINLLSNAIKFTQSGEVLVRVRSLGSAEGQAQVEFKVMDTGIGIPEEEVDHIFESFHQVDSSITRRYGGTGLGLAISRRLVEVMGGAITAQSVAGRGTTFRFALPLDLQDALPRLETGPDLTNSTILVMAEHPMARKRIRTTYSRQGAEVLEAENAEQVLALLDEHAHPAMILADVDMNDENGAALIRTLITRGMAPSAVAVLLRPNDLQAGTAMSDELGLGGYLVKPVRETELLRHAAARFNGGQKPRHSAPDAPGPGESPRILLADDTEDVRFLVAHFLKDLPYRLDLVKDGQKALELLETKRYDVVLMDMQMPVLDGYTATARLRRHEQDQNLKRTPVVALTAHAMSEDRQKCLDAGCDEYLSKPLRKAQLLDMLERMAHPAAGSPPEREGEAE